MVNEAVLAPAGALRSAGGVAAPTSEDGGRAAIGAGGSPQKQKQHAKRTSRRPTLAILRGRTRAPKGGCAVLCLQGWRTEEGWAADAPCSWLMRARKSLLWLRQARCMARVKHVLSRETTFWELRCALAATWAWESCIVVTPSLTRSARRPCARVGSSLQGGHRPFAAHLEGLYYDWKERYDQSASPFYARVRRVTRSPRAAHGACIVAMHCIFFECHAYWRGFV
jgi:hypothetical protein